MWPVTLAILTVVVPLAVLSFVLLLCYAAHEDHQRETIDRQEKQNQVIQQRAAEEAQRKQTERENKAYEASKQITPKTESVPAIRLSMTKSQVFKAYGTPDRIEEDVDYCAGFDRNNNCIVSKTTEMWYNTKSFCEYYPPSDTPGYGHFSGGYGNCEITIKNNNVISWTGFGHAFDSKYSP